MHSIRFLVVSLLAINLLLLGVAASQPLTRQDIEADKSKLGAGSVQSLQMVAEISDLPVAGIGLECFTVGPFENSKTADAVTELLGSHASRIRQRASEAFVDRGYWVYLPSSETPAEGRKALNALLDIGLEDVRLIESGDFNNAVSLGYFIEQDNARRRLDAIRELGFEAVMRIQRQDEPRYWVDYTQQAGVEYAYRILADMVPGELHRQVACPEGSIKAFTQAP